MLGAEGVVGLVCGVAALFASCIDCFEIMVSTKDYGYDYDFLRASLSTQKLRLFLRGESVGLASR